MKEVKRRREWGAGKDPLKLAGTPWPVFPRNAIAKVLGSLLEEVIGIDKATLGIFSQPVPKDDFPAYYEQIKNPMDYGKLKFVHSVAVFRPVTHMLLLLLFPGTMKEKLERGEYRSAQAMQKDFMLGMFPVCPLSPFHDILRSDDLIYLVVCLLADDQ